MLTTTATDATRTTATFREGPVRPSIYFSVNSTTDKGNAIAFAAKSVWREKTLAWIATPAGLILDRAPLMFGWHK